MVAAQSPGGTLGTSSTAGARVHEIPAQMTHGVYAFKPSGVSIRVSHVRAESEPVDRSEYVIVG